MQVTETNNKIDTFNAELITVITSNAKLRVREVQGGTLSTKETLNQIEQYSRTFNLIFSGIPYEEEKNVS